MVMREEPARYRGRDGELRLLAEALEGASSGRLTGVIVEGEPGIGKSRLLTEGFSAARDLGFQVAAGRAQELERGRPFGVLADALDCSPSSPDRRRAGIAALLATRVGEHGPMTVTSDPGLQFQVVDGFVDLVEELALARPLVIGLDDVQWADPSSLLTLDALSRRLAYVPLAVIVCLRPAPRVRQMERLLDTLLGVGAQQLSLEPLADEALAVLVADVVGSEPGLSLLAQVSAAGGNPLFVTELVSALADEDAIAIVDGKAEVIDAGLPPTMRLTILRRLSFLSEEALELLRSASVLGSSFALDELSTFTSRSAIDLASTTHEVLRSGVLIDDGNRLRFRHDLIREAIYEDLAPSVRVVLHRDAGQRMAAAGAPAVRVAEHFALGASQGNGDAIAWLTRAAREAAATSPGIASDLLGRAVELAVAGDASRDRLLVEQAGFLMWAGQIPEAGVICRALLDRPHDPNTEIPARICLGRCLATDGRGREALRELELVYGSSTATDAQQAASRAWASIAHTLLGNLDAASAAADEARAAATRADDRVMSSLALTTSSVVEECRAHFRDALQLVDAGVRCADASPGHQGHRYPHHAMRGGVLIELDRFEEARATLEIGMRVTEDIGVRWPLAGYHTIAAVECFASGEWDDATNAVGSAQELADELGERNNVALGHSLLSLIALHRNDMDQAEQAASAAAQELTGGGPRYRGLWSAWARALLLEADGATEAAYATLAECWDQCQMVGLAVEYPVLGPDLVRLAVAVGDQARADQVSSAVAAVAAGNDVPSLTGAALRCQGLRDDDPDVLRRAVDAYAQSPRPLELALAREESGAALARSGDIQAARPLLDQALDGYEPLEATRDIGRTRATQRKHGIHRGRRGARLRPRHGWESLTPSERVVSDLVSEGLSNPQIGERLFVSRRTVQTHVAHIFTKLQMSSRTELAAAVTRQRERS